MTNLHDLTLDQWNKNLSAFHAESDRGAALLAASFVENHLGSLLKSKMKNRDKANELFEGAGGLATFSQRISLAYAFGFIGKAERDDLELLRRIRNHFAHHPLDTSFNTNDIRQRVERLSNFENDAQNWPPEVQHRTAYLMACALLSAFLTSVSKMLRLQSSVNHEYCGEQRIYSLVSRLRGLTREMQRPLSAAESLTSASTTNITAADWEDRLSSAIDARLNKPSGLKPTMINLPR